jgi:hypothetical protein
MLYKRGYEREDVMQLLRFLDWLLRLPKELETETWSLVAELEGVKTMPYVTSFERLAEERGLEEGLRKGKEEGIREGIREGLLEAIELGLEPRFGKAALGLLPRIRQITDVEGLRILMTAKTLEEFEGLLPSAGA